jgi:hypothetical protein
MVQRYKSEETCLIEAIFTPVADIDHLDNLRSKTLIEHVTLAEFGFKIGRTGKYETGHIDLVVRNEVLD